MAIVGFVVGVVAVYAVATTSNGDGRARTEPVADGFNLPLEAYALPPGQPTADAVGGPLTEPADATEALRQVLTALAGGQPEAAYPLLDRASRQTYASPAAWTRAQVDRARPLTFEIGAAQDRPPQSDGATVTIGVTATHEPTLDPFRGLVPARSVSTWQVTREDGAFRVKADPLTMAAVLPGPEAATDAVRAWVARLAACDGTGAQRLQGVADLYGPADLPGKPCTQGGAWTVGTPVTIDQVPDPSTYLAAFGPSVTAWARAVPVRGPASSFLAAVAPLGDGWLVIGTAVA